jgi:uncharacterized SAM-binding protein YcdF (DUF218 family)
MVNFINRFERSWQVSHDLVTADAVYVLAGGNGNREAHAAALYQQALSPLILLCQATRQVQGHAIDVTRLVRAHLRQAGVPAEAIQVLPNQVHSTWEEAIQVAACARERGWTRLILVSDPYHTRRVLLTFRKACRGLDIQLYVSPCASELVTRTDWSPEVRLYALFIELLKTGYYSLRGRLV